MESYSIDEILPAVEKTNSRKNNKNKRPITQLLKKDYSEVPKHTLKLIEEAEETK